MTTHSFIFTDRDTGRETTVHITHGFPARVAALDAIAGAQWALGCRIGRLRVRPAAWSPDRELIDYIPESFKIGHGVVCHGRFGWVSPPFYDTYRALFQR